MGLTGDGIQILGSTVESSRLELPRDTTSLRVIKGYVSATVTLVGLLHESGCCSASLGIDANADGNVTSDERQAVQATGNEVRVTVDLPRAAPTVAYAFSITDAGGRTVARASGTYSFTNLNGVSATGEFDPMVVEHVTGSVERRPHLVQHDIGSSILLQTVGDSERQEEGPRVFFTMGTPKAVTKEAPGETAPTPSLSPVEVPSLLQHILGLFTCPGFGARRLLDRAR